MELNINDLGALQEAVFDARSKWYTIGLMLKVPVGTLDSIKSEYSDPLDQLRETLKAWLKTTRQPAWQAVADTLRSCAVGEPKLSSDIQTKYCQSTQTEVQILQQKLYLQEQQHQEATEADQRVIQQLTHQMEQLFQMGVWHILMIQGPLEFVHMIHVSNSGLHCQTVFTLTPAL